MLVNLVKWLLGLICYDVILKVNPILNLVMNCTHSITENFSKVVDIDQVSEAVIYIYIYIFWYVSISREDRDETLRRSLDFSLNNF